MANTSGGSSMDRAAGGNMASRNNGHGATSSSHSGSGHVTKVSTTRRRAHPPTRLGSEAPEPSQKRRKVLNEEEAPCGVSNAGKISAPSSAASRDPSGTSSSEDHAGGNTNEYATVGNARGSPIKRRCMRRSRYLGLFSSLKRKRTDEVVKSKQSTVPTKTKKVKESQFQKLQRLPDGCHSDFDNDHLCSVNKLLEFRRKSQGAVFVDDKEHVMKIIFFISSVLPDACHSFLLVTTSSLALWKSEFNRLAPSINVVVFDGEKAVLELIQNPEFHENENHTMLHVLLAHPDVIVEDIKSVEGIVWESVIVDYCQDSVAKHLRQLRQLPTDFRMVLLSSPLKDSLPEYKNLLDFLNSEQENSGDYIEADSLAMLRARFTRHIAYERKAVSSKLLEYWVPVYLSQVQLELYSSILLANSSILQSEMTTDSVGALCDVFMSLWKCCNHPCLVDQQHSLANTRDITESADDRMCMSGKLLLLQKMLTEIRNKRLRVIVLFQQSDGTAGDRMGNILEDLVRHKFGPESYERVQNRSAFAMKQEAMNMFNDTTKGRFVFLIDSRACQPSINLSSIDSIIIYGSDLNPLNDLKALRKIKIGSPLKYVRIFRLYTPFTVEEKSLVLAKQSMIIDSNSQDITSSLSHCLVSWGVSFIFNRVDELQQDNYTSKSNERGTIFMDKVILEFLTQLSTEVEDSSKVNSTTISKACMSGEFYSRNITLIGEREGVSSLDGDPSKFWLNLLDGKSYCQRYKPIEVATEETYTSRRKRRNTCVINHDLLPEISPPSSADLHLLPETGVENMSTPKSLHAELKRELSNLMTVLKLPDNVLFLAKQFLDYLLKNHLVVREPRYILHAFNIALCWRAASFLKYTKLDHRESLALASDGLNYECNEELTKFFYKKIGILEEKVAHKPGGRVNDRLLSPHESSSAILSSDHNFPKQAMDLHGNFTNGAEDSVSAAEQMVMVSDEQELVSAPDADREQHLLCEESPSSDVTKRINIFNITFSSREMDIIEKQQLDILNLTTQRDNQVKKLKEVCHAVVQHIRISSTDEEMKTDQIKLVIQWFTMFMHSFLAHMRLQFSKLEVLHSTTLAEEQLMKEKLKHEVISGELDQFPDPCVTLPDSNSVVEEFIHFKKQNGDNHVDKELALDGDQLLDDTSMEITIVRSSFSPEACPTLAVINEPTEAHMRSGGRAASECVDLPDNNNHCSSDGIEYQRACSASSIPTSHDSINQESSTGDGRSIEHAKGDNIAKPSMFPGSATSPVGINAENDSTVASDPDHMESHILSSPQNVTTLQHPTAAEPSDTLPAMAAQDLQTEMQTACPTLGPQHQKACPDDSSKMNIEPDTATGMLQEGTTSDHFGDSSKMNIEPDTTTGMLQEETASDHLDDSIMGVKEKNIDTVAADPLNSEIRSYVAPNNPSVEPEAWVAETQSDQSSMPAEHSTSLPTQRKLPISGHPTEEADPSSNLDTEAAQQPDIQPSSSTLDADSSEIRHQPETTTVLSQGGSKNHDVDNDGTVCAQKAHSESPILAVEPEAWVAETQSDQSSMPAQHSTSGTTPAQNLQPETQPSTSAQHIPPERTPPDERIQIGLQPNMTSGSERLAQLSTVAPASLLRSSEPLINELERLKYYSAVLSKTHEQKKLQLQTECNEEMEKVKEKYELLLQEEDSAYQRLITDLNRVYSKVFAHQLLAEEFQDKFKELPDQETSASPTIWQAPQSSQYAPPCGTTAAQTALLSVASSSTGPPVLISSHTAGPYFQTSQVARPLVSGAIQLQPVLPGNLSRAAPSPIGSMPPRNGIYGAVGAQSRRRAPHLQQPRMPAPSTIVRRDEQQPIITNLGFVPSRQSAPGMFESSASGNAPSASNSHPAFPASALLPGSGPDSMVNFSQSNSRIPVGMASQQAPGLNQAFHMGGGPLNTESRIQQALAHIGGTAQGAPDQSQEALHRLLQQCPQVMAPSSVQPTASSSHPAAPMAARQQAVFLNPAPDNMAGPLNAAAGVWNPVIGIGSQSYQLSASLSEWEALRRVGVIPGHPSTYPQGGAGLTGTSPQGSSGTSREVVCLSDDEE